MNTDQLAELIKRELREACPRGTFQPYDDDGVGLYYMSTQTHRGERIHLHLLVHFNEDHPRICVQARAVCVFADHLTTTPRGETLRLRSGEEFPGGNTELSEQFADGLGSVEWEFAMEDHARAVRLARGIAAIASEFFVSDMLAESLAGRFSSAFPGTEVMCHDESFRADCGPFTLSVCVANVFTDEGIVGVYVWPVDLLGGLFVSDNTVVLPNGEEYPNCEVNCEVDDERDCVSCFFSYNSEQDRPVALARLHAFVEGVARLAAPRFGNQAAQASGGY